MAAEFPYRGRYSVKHFIECPIYYRSVAVGYVSGWALGHEEDGELHEVVICDQQLCDDETKWIAVSMDESGPLELAARALWLCAQTPEVRHMLADEFSEYEYARREMAAEAYYDSVREDRLLRAAE